MATIDKPVQTFFGTQPFDPSFLKDIWEDNPHPLKWAIDLDGVLADYMDIFLHYYFQEISSKEARRLNSLGFTAKASEKITKMNFIELGLDKDQYNAFHHQFVKEGLLIQAQPVVGAVEAMQSFSSFGDEIHLVTHRGVVQGDNTFETRISGSQSRRWADKYQIPYSRFVQVADKAAYAKQFELDFAVDDSPSVVEAYEKAGVKVFPFRQEYNREELPQAYEHWDAIRIAAIDKRKSRQLIIPGKPGQLQTQFEVARGVSAFVPSGMSASQMKAA